MRISNIVVENPPQLLKSEVPNPVPVMIDTTLNEAILRASRYGIFFEVRYIEIIRTTKKTRLKNNLTWSSLIKFFHPFLVIER